MLDSPQKWLFWHDEMSKARAWVSITGSMILYYPLEIKSNKIQHPVKRIYVGKSIFIPQVVINIWSHAGVTVPRARSLESRSLVIIDGHWLYAVVLIKFFI